MLLKIGVRICPSFWYQMAFFRVLAHGLYARNFLYEGKLCTRKVRDFAMALRSEMFPGLSRNGPQSSKSIPESLKQRLKPF